VKRFLTLRKFLLLTEPCSKHHSSFGCTAEPKKFVEWYDKAKASWEKYGDIGPPIPSKVRTLRGGFGCPSAGYIRTLGVSVKYPGYFILVREGGVSLSSREQWWIDFEVVE